MTCELALVNWCMSEQALERCWLASGFNHRMVDRTCKIGRDGWVLTSNSCLLLVEFTHSFGGERIGAMMVEGRPVL